MNRSPWCTWMFLGVMACAGCRAAYAQSASPQRRTQRVTQQYLDAALGDTGHLDAARDGTARDATLDASNDAERDSGASGRDSGRPPLTMPSRPSPDRPIGGGPNEGPQEPIPVDDAGRFPLR